MRNMVPNPHGWLWELKVKIYQTAERFTMNQDQDKVLGIQNQFKTISLHSNEESTDD